MSIASVKDALRRGGLTPNRALGQNFLADETVIAAILDGAEIDGKRVLEIGPGLGALTEGLIKRASAVVAIEKDAEMAAGLVSALPAENLTVVTADFLDADIRSLLGDEPFAAVGNLPYYATTPMVEKLLGLLPESMTLMVQREAADRFTARPGDRVYGPVAVTTALCYEARPLLDVPASAFYPAPEVESRVMRLVKKPRVPDGEGKALLAYLKRVFAMRRKTLRNVMGREPGFDRAAESLNLPAGVRAEALPPETLYALYQLRKEETTHA